MECKSSATLVISLEAISLYRYSEMAFFVIKFHNYLRLLPLPAYEKSFKNGKLRTLYSKEIISSI
jgi:hypothetical protein